MQVPKEIFGRKKQRDFIICCDYISGKSPEEIIKERNLNLSVRRVYNILFRNQAFIHPRITWPKTQRIWLRQRLVDQANKKSKKDITELLDGLQREVDGNQPVIDQSEHVHITYAWKTGQDDTDRLQPPEVSAGDSSRLK